MILRRNRDGVGCTRGTLELADGEVLQTLELEWRDNERNVSCIPAGRHALELYEPHKESLGVGLHDRLGRWCLKVMDVPDRSDILMHVANWAHQLLGCIAVGQSGGPQSIDHSRKALGLVLAAWREGDRELTIVEAA